MFKRVFKYGFIGAVIGLALGYVLNADPIYFFVPVFAVIFAFIGFVVELFCMLLNGSARRYSKSRRGKANDLWWRNVAR